MGKVSDKLSASKHFQKNALFKILKQKYLVIEGMGVCVSESHSKKLTLAVTHV